MFAPKQNRGRNDVQLFQNVQTLIYCSLMLRYMKRLFHLPVLFLLLMPLLATSANSEKALTKEARIAFIRKAQVWLPTNVSGMDLRAGPQGPDALAPDQTVNCDYVETKLAGSSRKFDCTIREGDVAKVKYGKTNGEVQGQVLASRLLWALGFGADRAYPVTVICRGCSPDPWTKRKKVEGEQKFEPAMIERNPEGHEIKIEQERGWAWPELALIDETQGGATKAQRGRPHAARRFHATHR